MLVNVMLVNVMLVNVMLVNVDPNSQIELTHVLIL
jgi:hypothetical protein